MDIAALCIGYVILAILAILIVLFALALGYYAIQEAGGFIYSRKWRKRKLRQLEIETGRDCAYYLKRWKLPEETTINEACKCFDEALRMFEK